MVRCPNCGQKTSGDYCQWCKYPILRRSPARRRMAKKRAKKEAELATREKTKGAAEKQTKKEAELATREKTKREVEKARKAKEAEKQTKKEAKIATRKKAKRGAEEAKLAAPLPIVFDQVKQIEECLKQVESICEELRAGKVDTKEALQRLSDISEKIAK